MTDDPVRKCVMPGVPRAAYMPIAPGTPVFGACCATLIHGSHEADRRDAPVTTG